MNIEELKKALTTEVPASSTWLQNQYPALLTKRCSSLTYLNYQNLEDCSGVEARKSMEAFLAKHLGHNIVIVAELTKSGKPKKKLRIFADNEALYYTQYELFGCAAHMEGFVEVFHTIKN